MATDWQEMTDYFSEKTAGREFSPCAHYDPDADALTFYFSNESDYAKRLNSRVTIYLSDETDELVGCRVKGVRSVLEDIGEFDVAVSHGKIRLKMLFVAFQAVFADSPDARVVYRKIGHAVKESDLELELPEPV